MPSNARSNALTDRFIEIHGRKPDVDERVLLNFLIDIGPAYDRNHERLREAYTYTRGVSIAGAKERKTWQLKRNRYLDIEKKLNEISILSRKLLGIHITDMGYNKKGGK